MADAQTSNLSPTGLITKTEEDHPKTLESLQLLLSYNETKLECMYETNKLNMHTTGVPT